MAKGPDFEQVGETITLVLSMLIFVAIISVILSQKAQTTGVIKSAADGLSSILKTALSPINGG